MSDGVVGMSASWAGLEREATRFPEFVAAMVKVVHANSSATGELLDVSEVSYPHACRLPAG